MYLKRTYVAVCMVRHGSSPPPPPNFRGGLKQKIKLGGGGGAKFKGGPKILWGAYEHSW